ncbi:14252_t:CDS:2, partial [Dentiscutata erythropus]
VVDLYSFESLALVKKFKQDLARLIYKIQYAIEGKLKEGEYSKLWNKILQKIIDYMNNNKTRLIDMLPSYAMSLGEVIPKVSTKPKRPIGKDESLLQKRLIPVLYYLEDEPIDSTKHLIGRNPKRPFKREELQ